VLAHPRERRVGVRPEFGAVEVVFALDQSHCDELKLAARG
jgi:hypothetical protein